MTNGRSGGGSGMASFMTKKKKYRFQVEVLVEELLEVPFVSAVLFAKLRLLDGGNFQTHTKREEVVDHTVKWNTRFSFQCKMLAPASTGVLEPCVLRISVRKECKGGRSFTKLGFVDLNLAEFAGAGETSRKALLEGYDTRRRQDNSMLKFSIKMNMLAGDVLFKVPSPSLKHKPVTSEECLPDPVLPDEFSAGSLAGSIASASSGFGSLPKKRPPLLTSELTIGQTLSENSVPVSIATDNSGDVVMALKEPEECLNEPGHSRNSSNTSQMSKASGYSSIHSHSRHSSSGDSGHIRGLSHRKILEGGSGGKLAPVANSPDEAPFVSSDSSLNPQVRRPSITKNHSSGSLVLSETGSLDRAKAALERRKKAQNQDTELATVSGRVEGTRVNPDHLIAELLKNTNLEQTDDSAESSGLQLFIAKDGTAALGNHEVKSQMSTGAQLFKQVVMEDKR
ncbi:protein FAM102B isoform X3 [Agrilus planipennis]|uniref:Protein FAM102B isoform X3 n=1 Tax=Agrilus planipennis TaxID=224129 RepID=A0A1W4XPU7_AGRPL|nr:protein FAM102B isoform X3 [Agrilus planipennis]